ncbi:MAG: glutamyl-tRNA reductase [Desulfobacterales bacterium]
MQNIIILGLNHKTAPIELRENLAFSEEEAERALVALQELPSLKEVVLISTCNRVEVLMFAENHSDVVEPVKTFLAEFKDVPISEFENAFYTHRGEAAIKHIFRVASSLDSMVVGEPQILGQVKEAYKTAIRKKTSSVILNRLLHRTFSVAKRIRTETGIGDHAVSISYAAIELGRKIFGSLEDKKVLLIGAGEMAELAIEHLIRNRVGNIHVANRTFENAVTLAEGFNGEAIRFEEITDSLSTVDIIISSTGSPDFIVTADQVKSIRRQRRNRPIFFIDIAVPRDIDPKINLLTNAYVYDIDDLQGVIEGNIEDRNKAAVKGERIVNEAVIRFRAWFDSLDVVPTIVALREKAEAIAQGEMKKTLGALNHLSEKDTDAIERMIRSLVNKLLHDPMLSLKTPGRHRDKSVFLDITRKLFNLDP